MEPKFLTPYEQHTDQGHVRMLTMEYDGRVVRIMVPLRKVPVYSLKAHNLSQSERTGEKWVEDEGYHKVGYDVQLRGYLGFVGY